MTRSSVEVGSAFPGILFVTKTKTVRTDLMRMTVIVPVVPEKHSRAMTERVYPGPVSVTVAGNVRTAVTRPAVTRGSHVMKKVSDARVASAYRSMLSVMQSLIASMAAMKWMLSVKMVI